MPCLAQAEACAIRFGKLRVPSGTARLRRKPSRDRQGALPRWSRR